MDILIISVTFFVIFFSTIVFCVKKNAIRLNGFLFFSIGFVYYWLIPSVLMYFLESSMPEELDLVFSRYSRISEDNKLLYVILSCIFYVLFAIGYSIARGTSEKKNKIISKKSNAVVFFWSFMALLGVVLATVMALPISNYFFKAYDSSLFENYQDGVVQDAIPRGTFIAATSILFILCFMRAVIKNGHLKKINKIIFDPYMLIYYVFAILALSMGGRLYFVTNIIAIIIFFSVYFDLKIRLREFFLIGMMGAGVAALWGVLRAGGNFSFGNMLLNLAQEPLLTSVSAFAFLEDGKFPLLNFPIFLISDFTNLLPSSLFPEKIQYLLNPQDLGYEIYMPLGGLHIFVSLVINFGIVGAAFFFTCIGFLVGKFERSSMSVQAVTIYCFVCSWLTFSLNRDPFSVSLVKNIFEISLLIPLILYLIQKIIFKKHV